MRPAGPECEEVYKTGAAAEAGFPSKAHMYIIRKVGPFPDVCEALSASHLAKGDKVSDDEIYTSLS